MSRSRADARSNSHVDLYHWEIGGSYEIHNLRSTQALLTAATLVTCIDFSRGVRETHCLYTFEKGNGLHTLFETTLLRTYSLVYDEGRGFESGTLASTRDKEFGGNMVGIVGIVVVVTDVVLLVRVGVGDGEVVCTVVNRHLEFYDDTVMSDYEDSTVTYTAVSSPFGGSLYRPPSPDYIPGLEEPQSPPPPDFVPEIVYPEFMPQKDEVFSAEEQPLPAAASPTAQSPDYVLEFDPEADPEEDDDEDPEEDPTDYPTDRGDDGIDKDEPFDDDKDEEVDTEADDEEEEEHPAPTDSTVVALPAVNQAPSAKETEQFETDESAATPLPHLAYRVIARISIPSPVPTPIPFPSLPLILSPLPISPPLPQIPSPPLPVSSQYLCYLHHHLLVLFVRCWAIKLRWIRLRAEVESTSYSLTITPPIILPHTEKNAPSSGTPPLHLLSIDRRADKLIEVTLPPRKRLGITLGPGYEVRESSSAAAARPARGLRADYGFVATIDREIRRDLERDVGYGITDSWDEIVETMQGAPASADTELGRHMTEFETRVRQDTDEIYTRLDDEQTERQLLAGRLNMLFRDRRAHARTARLMEAEARMSREAWG
ncbi:hypothetical protein Tco_1235918 [Tanacetum coccineum]